MIARTAKSMTDKIPAHPTHRSATAVLPDRWAMRLNVAASPEEVVQVARFFLETWTEEELAMLPADCVPRRFDSAQDLCSYAFALVQAQLEFEGPMAAGVLLDRMTVFFSYASSRIAHLRHIDRVRV